MYIKYGINKTLLLLDGVFAFILYDLDNNYIYIARDPIGIRSLYYGYNI
jgi:asparagine synthase (glutamine-hydrolysing)